MKKSILFLFSLIICMLVNFYVNNNSFAEYEWNSDLGRFVEVGTVFYGNPEEQFKYAEKLVKEKNIKKAKEAFNFLYVKFPDTAYAVKSLIRLAELQEQERDYYRAFKTYQKVLDFYPNSDYGDDIVKREMKIANLFLSGEKARFYGVPILPSLPKAIEIYKAIVDNTPFSEYGEIAQFKLGLAYKKKGKAKESISVFQKFIDNYPQNNKRAEAEYQIAEIMYKMSMRHDRDRKLRLKAKARLEDFIRHYPGSQEAEKLLENLKDLMNRDVMKIYQSAEFYESRGYPKSAVIYYNEILNIYPETKAAEKAKERLKYLNNPDDVLLSKQETLKQLRKEYAELMEEKTDKGSEKQEIVDEIKKIKRKLELIDKQKKSDLKLRWRELKRKETELKLKKREFKEKQKMFNNKKSDDVDIFMNKWRLSLLDEENALKAEKRELLKLEKQLGIRRFSHFTKKFSRSRLNAIKKYKKRTLNKLYKKEYELRKQKELLSKFLNVEKNIDNEDIGTIFSNNLRSKSVDENYNDKKQLFLKNKLAAVDRKIKAELEEVKKIKNLILNIDRCNDFFIADEKKSFDRKDKRDIKKQLMRIEKEINNLNNKIYEAFKKKSMILTEIEGYSPPESFLKSSVNFIIWPLRASFNTINAFIFGLPNREKAAVEKMEKLSFNSSDIDLKTDDLKKKLDIIDEEITDWQRGIRLKKAELSVLLKRVDDVLNGEKVKSGKQYYDSLQTELESRENYIKILNIERKSVITELKTTSMDSAVLKPASVLDNNIVNHEETLNLQSIKKDKKKLDKIKKKIMDIEHEEKEILLKIKDIIATKVLRLKELEQRSNDKIMDDKIIELRKKLFKELDEVNSYIFLIKGEM